MNTQQDESDSASGPLIDFMVDGRPESDLAGWSPVAHEPTTPGRHSPTTPETPASTSPFPPARSIRELVESLGSPVHSDTSPRPSLVSRPASNRLDLTSPSPFDDPVSFGNQSGGRHENEHETIGPYSYPDCAPCDPTTNVDSIPSATPPDQVHAPKRSFGQDRSSVLNLPNEESGFSHSDPSPAFNPIPTSTEPTPSMLHPILPSWSPQTPTAPIPIPPRLSSTRQNFSYARRSDPNYAHRTNLSPPRALPAPPGASLSIPSYPWNRPSPDTLGRPDRFSRTTAHTTISDILFNFDLDPSSAAELIEDACQTARQVGVSTQDLLSRSVFLGTFDLGMTPLCLEASRVDIGAGLELVLWLIENTGSADVDGEVRKGCLMRCNGMGEQSVWNILRSFIPEGYGEGASVAYDVDVEGLAVVPVGAGPSAGPSATGPVETQSGAEDSDEGSLYDDVSIIDAESSYLDQADIETLKSSDDERDQESQNQCQNEERPCRVHRARILLPSFKESLTGPSWSFTSPSRSNRFGMASSGGVGDKLLTAEWIFEGRIWALSIGEDSLILTLRQTSSVVSSDPVHVTAIVRLLPLDLYWTEAKPIEQIGSDRLLPTEMPSDVLLSSPLYEWKPEEKVLVPGPVRVGASSSVWKTEIRASDFSILELVGDQSGIKVEVVVRVLEKQKREAAVAPSAGPSVSRSTADDVSDWQFIDD
ncbi:unnamed protein product [Rhizoctonia solani]|uniref:Uncharacterized protein n=1 Tax=Rhizoctonia solani TaxID=456999 RepID=A0A8H2W5R3_9AGAM|nr:unnamed protein product [Rhizoctonia solani]